MYECKNIAYCHTISPDNELAAGNPVLGAGVSDKVWDTTAKDIVEDVGAIRSTDDITTYKTSGTYSKGDVVSHCGKTYECANPKSCSAGAKDTKKAVKPSKTAAGVWQTPVTGKGETGLDVMPESAKLVVAKWKRAPKDMTKMVYSNAYEVGSMALNKVKKGDTATPKAHMCDPETI